MNRTKDLLIIIPAYNEEDCLGSFLEQLEAPEITGVADILVIDDGSSDGTDMIIRSKNIPSVRHVYNIGYGAALMTGYKYAIRHHYQYVIQIDADGQHDPCNILALYRKLQEQDENGHSPDIVLGSRFLEGGKSFPISRMKKLAIRAFRKLIHMTVGTTITDPTTGLQGLSRRTVLYYSIYSHFDLRFPDANMLIQTMLLGYRVEEIPAVMHPRASGTSMHHGLGPMIYMAHMFFSICAIWLRVHVMKKETLQGPKNT